MGTTIHLMLISSVLLIILTHCFANHLINDRCHLCVNSSLSCSHQLWNLDTSPRVKEDCWMQFFIKNSAECKLLSFSGESTEDLGIVVLEPYIYTHNTLAVTAFNSSFSHIKWDYLRMRYMSQANSDENLCREFRLAENASVSEEDEVFFDCLFNYSSYEGLNYSFEYEAGKKSKKESKKYVFSVPLAKDSDKRKTKLEEWQLFVFVDIKVQEPYTVHWYALPEKFGVEKFLVEVWYQDGDNMSLQESAEVPALGKRLKYQMSGYPLGKLFHFSVYPLSDNCTGGKCRMSLSQKIPYYESQLLKPLYHTALGAVILIPVFFLAFHVWRKKMRYSPDDIGRPSVLIIYTPTLTSHVQAMVALTKYLNLYCGIEALLDKLDIPLSKTMDPFTWCNEAFGRVDYVMVVSSPSWGPGSPQGIYRNVDAVGLQLLKEKFGVHTQKPQFFAVMLPYCKERDLPPEGRNLRRFNLPRGLDSMLNYLHRDGLQYCPMALRPRLPGGRDDLKVYGKVLVEAFQKVQEDLVRLPPCRSEITACRPEVLLKSLDRPLHPENFISDQPELDILEGRQWDPELFPLKIQDLPLLGEQDPPAVSTNRNKPGNTEGFNIHSLNL